MAVSTATGDATVCTTLPTYGPSSPGTVECRQACVGRSWGLCKAPLGLKRVTFTPISTGFGHLGRPRHAKGVHQLFPGHKLGPGEPLMSLWPMSGPPGGRNEHLPVESERLKKTAVSPVFGRFDGHGRCDRVHHAAYLWAIIPWDCGMPPRVRRPVVGVV